MKFKNNSNSKGISAYGGLLLDALLGFRFFLLAVKKNNSGVPVCVANRGAMARERQEHHVNSRKANGAGVAPWICWPSSSWRSMLAGLALHPAAVSP